MQMAYLLVFKLGTKVKIPGSSSNECGPYYCCFNSTCHVGSHERLVEGVDPGVTVLIIKDPYGGSTYPYNSKEVNCTDFDPKVGRPLVEFSPKAS